MVAGWDRRPGGAMTQAPTAAVEDYLKAIYGLAERTGGSVTTTALARRLGLTVSTVSGMVRRLRAAELVTHRRYGSLELSAEGHRAALMVLRRHRLIETYLFAVLGYGWDEVHDEAEVLEHAVSDRLLQRMADQLGHPERDPHGDPIPGVDGRILAGPTRRLSVLEPGQTGTVARVGDMSTSLLCWLSEQGVGLGDRVEVVGWEASGPLRVWMGPHDEPLALGAAAASSIEITVDEDPALASSGPEPRR
ncbi:MAG: metal-dependent transcriptional regulator [Actinomycetota bacterium]|nr:metal-dependent transcriptional regulator [Actinomycetota bacterium]